MYMTTKNIQTFLKLNGIIHIKTTQGELMKVNCLPKLGIIQALLKTFNAKFQNKK